MHYILYYEKDKTLKTTKYNDVFDDLYYFKAKIPTEKNITDYINKGEDKNLIKYLKSDTSVHIINEIKKNISQIDFKIPLYDEYTKNLYIIPREQVYKRVIYVS